MKKLFLTLILLFVVISIANAYTWNYNILKAGTVYRGTAACTLVVPECRGALAIYVWTKADTVKNADTIGRPQIKWQYSVDNSTWTAGATLRDSIVGTSYNTWVIDSIITRQHPHLRLIYTGVAGDSRCKLYSRAFIVK